MIKTLLLIDADATRCSWLGAGLEARGFLLLSSVSSLEAAIQTITRCHPNVVLIAPTVAKVSGPSIARTIMESYPVPIVLMTGLNDDATTKEAGWCGATTIVQVPYGPDDHQHSAQLDEIAEKLRLMSEIPVVKRRSSEASKKNVPRHQLAEQKMTRLSIAPISNIVQTTTPLPTSKTNTPLQRIACDYNNPPSLIGIVASTGGPIVVQQVLAHLPADFKIPIVVIQHLTKGFSDTLVKWLDNALQLKVVEACHGDIARPGHVYVVSGQMHAILHSGLRLNLLASKSYPGHCPSGTLFLNSMANLLGSKSLGIVLTGMGSDGSEGLLAIRKKKGVTITQTEESCTMASMPHECISIGAASYVLSPEAIGQTLSKYHKTAI